jgi:hypothetical protein
MAILTQKIGEAIGILEEIEPILPNNPQVKSLFHQAFYNLAVITELIDYPRKE